MQNLGYHNGIPEALGFWKHRPLHTHTQQSSPSGPAIQNTTLPRIPCGTAIPAPPAARSSAQARRAAGSSALSNW